MEQVQTEQVNVQGTEQKAQPVISDAAKAKLQMLSGLPGGKQIIEDTNKEIQQIEAEHAKKQAAQPQAKAPEAKVTPEIKTPEQKPENTEGQEGGSKTTEEQGSKSLFFGDKKKKKEATPELKFENNDDWANVAKSWGVEVKEAKDFNKVVGTVNKWRDAAQKLPEVEKQAEEIKGLLENLDPDLLEDVKTYYRGEDWRKGREKEKPFDILKPVEKQDTKKLIDHYFPGEFTTEDFEMDEKPKALEIAEKSAKDKFIAEQNNYNSKRATEIEKGKQRLALKAQSIDGSVKNLKQSFPDADNTIISSVKKTLESGDIDSLFFNKDGSYKQEAATRLMLAMHGEQELRNMFEIESGKIESRVMEEVVTRGADKPRPQQGAGQGQGIKHSAEYLKQMQAINGIGGSKKTY